MTCIALADVCFEISFEVCNKVGGIYTVVSSKAKQMVEKYKNYFLFGPYFEEKALDEFEPLDTPAEFKHIFDKLKNEGIKLYFGRWNIKGKPYIFLIDYKGYFSRENELKGFFWEHFKIDSLGKGYDFSEPMIFSVACARFIEEYYYMNQDKNKKIITHCHEWITGFCGLYLKQKGLKIGTIFTTHATMLGRTMSSYDFVLHANLDKIDPDFEAKKANVQEKHLTEVACAHNFDVFTTVSSFTANECKYILKKNPDVVLLNGLNLDDFPTFEEASIKHRIVREMIHNFNSYFFGPYQKVDFSNTLFLYTSGRYEFKNKGLDIFTKSLGILNEDLKKDPNSKTIYVFFLIPNGVQNIKTQLIFNKNKLLEIKDQISKSVHNVELNILKETINNDEIKVETILSPEDKRELDKLKREFHIKYQSPFLLTHTTFDEENNCILNCMKANNLTNKPEDKVKVVYYPLYVDIDDGVFNLHYYELVEGFHLGVFASYYEPFGYTPFESIALSVPSITCDLAGFGRFIKENHLDGEGVYVLNRTTQNFDDAAKNLYQTIKKYISNDLNTRVEQKMKARKTATYLDWKLLIDNYIEAHNLALMKNKLI